MPTVRVSRLTREDIVAAAKRLRGGRSAKWTVVVDGCELPARPLVLEAAGVPPNDPTNSHQAVAILRERGFDVLYKGTNISSLEHDAGPAAIDDLILSLRGCFKPKAGEPSLVEVREREHRNEKDRWPK